MIVDPDFLTHWKTQMLIAELGDKAAPLYLIALWAHCQQRRTDTFHGMAPSGLKAVCRYEGEASKLRSALERCGWIVLQGEAVIVHGWAESNAKLIANWENGQKGGRPKKPNRNPQITQLEVGVTQQEPIEKSREEKIERPPKVPLSQIVDRWNATEGVVSIRQLNNKRVVALKARLAEDDWLWEEALAKFPLMCFQDSDGWKPNFDWFIKPNTVGKILEGAYDWKKESGVEKKPYRYDRQKLIEEAKSWRP